MGKIHISLDYITAKLGGQQIQENAPMTETADKFEGGCLCGAVRFIVIGRPKGNILVPLPELPQA